MPGAPLPTRRAVLTVLAWAAGALLLAGCTGEESAPDPTPSPPPPLTPDEVIAGEILAAKRQILVEYAAASAPLPALGAALAPLVAAHEAHALAVADFARATPTPAATGTPTGPATGPAEGVATDPPNGSTAAPSDDGTASPGGGSPAVPSDSTASPGGGSSSPATPPDAASLLAALAARELAFAAARIEQSGRASGPLARLVASIGAAEAVHAALLPGLAAR